MKEKTLSGVNQDSPFGKIPFDWKVKELISCASYVDYRGKTPTKTESGRFLVTAKNIRDGFIDYENSKEYVSEKDYESVMRRGKPKSGDILITTEAPLGNVAAVDREDIALAQRVIKYRAMPEIINAGFLFQFLSSDIFQSILSLKSTGSTAKGIKGSVLHRLPIGVPPLLEQKAIASVLSLMDSAIHKTNRLIAQKILRKKALMQQLLAGKKRLKGFAESWREIQLGEVFKEITDTNDGGDAHSIMTVSSRLGLISQEDKFDRVIAGESLKKYTQLKREDFAYNKGNSKTYQMGCVYQLEDRDTALVPFVYICFSPGKDVHSTFYKQWFSAHGLDRQLKRIITSGARGDGLLNVDTEDFFKLNVPLLTMKEQVAIAQVLQTADREIDLLKSKAEKLREQKKGMMQLLLTGKKRLKRFRQ